MTPIIDPAEVNHNPGPIFLGMLKDYGHTIGRIITFNTPLSNNCIVKGQNFNITWHDNISDFGDYINFKLYKVTPVEPMFIGYINGNNNIFSNPGTLGNLYSWSVPTYLENNFYFIRAEGSNHLVDYGQSQVFSISDTPESPKFNPPGSQYNTPQWVHLSTNSPVTEIRYTENGSEPDETSNLFTSDIFVDVSKTIRAKSILVLPNGTKVLSPSSDATYFIGSNSFVKEFTSPYYGFYGYDGTYSYQSSLDGLVIGKATSNVVYRSFIDWNNIRTQIPSGSLIQSVEIVLPLEPFNTPASIEFREFTRAPYWTQNWDSLGSGALITTMNANLQVFNVAGLISKVQNIVNGVVGDLVRIGITNANENEYSHLVQFPWNNPVLRIYYRGNVEISQLDKDDEPFGQVGYWNGTTWENKNVPATVFKSGSITLKSYQGYKENTTQKYNQWLDQSDVINFTTLSISSGVNYFTSKFNEADLSTKVKNYLFEAPTIDPTSDKIWFKDPWLIDETVALYGLRNQGISGGNIDEPGADWYQLDSPIDFSQPNFTTYKGVFFNQDPTFDPDIPNYSVKVDQLQDISLTNTGITTGRNHKFYFQNWSGTNANFQNANNLETPVVFTLDNATAQANLKGTQLTNTPFQFGVGQRGFVRSTNGYLHNVYESMGDIFYERSTDQGSTWLLMNNGKPINPDYATASAKSPSVCFDASYDLLYIVYQGSTFPYDGIVLAQFNTAQLTNIPNWVQPLTGISNFSYSNNYKPVIAAMGSSGIVVYDPPSTVTAGLKALKFTIGSYLGYSLIGTTEFTIPGADYNSSNPSITAGCQYYYLVYQQAETSIRYTSWNGGSNPSAYSDVSSGSSYIFNVRPTISLTHCTYPVVSWIGGTYDYYHSGFYYGSCALTRVGPTWGSIKIISTSNAQAINNNSTTEYGSEYKSIISYSYGSGPYYTKWVKRTGTSYTTPASLSYNGFPINGIFPQVSSGASTNEMKALVYNSYSLLPYYFIQSTTSFGTVSAEVSSISGDNISLSKISENDTIITFGRSGVASINDIEFVFGIGDIIVGDSIIKFIDIPDTLVYSTTNELNQHTRTNNFTLTPETNFYFSNIYSVVKKSNPDSALTVSDAVNFKAELVNASTNQVVGTFDNITYNKNNLEKYASIDYSVDCSGIAAGDYYLRLVTNVNGNASYTLANIVSDNTTLAKKNFNKVNFTGSEIPTTYDLAQNFPNPFNPSTTIRYQLPQDGMVTLKIYDILGSEVATLVNEEKIAGMYEVNFNASSLASGVYIYKIQTGEFTATKKLMLLSNS